MSKPVDWTVGIPASTLIAVGTLVSGRFPLDGAGARNLTLPHGWQKHYQLYRLR